MLPNIQSLIFKYICVDALSLKITTSKINIILKEYKIPPLTEKQIELFNNAENINYAIACQKVNPKGK